MSDTGPPPVIPDQLQQYNSYAADPTYQIKFTIVWTAVLAFTLVVLFPRVIFRRQKWWDGTFGVLDEWKSRDNYARLKIEEIEKARITGLDKGMSTSAENRVLRKLPSQSQCPDPFKTAVSRILTSISSLAYYTPAYPNGLSIAQIFLVIAYLATTLICTAHSVPLFTNSNRAGFLALAQLPPLFLLSAKSSPLSLLLPSHLSYTRLNFLHRWSARGVLLCVVIHGALWIRDHRMWGIPILGQQKEVSGIAAMGVLCVLGLGSVRVVRERYWAVFYWVHFSAFPAFIITICYHTPYASPWILAPISIHAFDLLMRSLRIRFKDAFLLRVDENMTIIHIPDCDAGFRAGQHLRIRIFFGGAAGVFEAHPLSIVTSPSSETCICTGDVRAYSYPSPSAGSGGKRGACGGEPAGIVLGARVAGDWTKALNDYAYRQETRLRSSSPASASASASVVSSSSSSSSSPPTPIRIPVPVQVMFDGAYGGCKLDMETFERVLIVAGGSGATFGVGMLDGIVARVCSRGCTPNMPVLKTRRVDFVWCVRSIASISWFAPLLRAIASAAQSRVDLRMAVFVTCVGDGPVEELPRLRVEMGARPHMKALVSDVMGLGAAGGDDGPGTVGSEADGRVDLAESRGCSCVVEAREGLQDGRDKVSEKERDVEERFRGRVAVCVSGPRGMASAAANAVARLTGKGGVGVELHTEVFVI